MFASGTLCFGAVSMIQARENGEKELSTTVRMSYDARARYHGGGSRMKIDIYNHIFPKKFFERMLTIREKGSNMQRRVSEIPSLVDLDLRFRIMDGFGDYVQVISLPSPPIEAFGDPQTSP